MSAPSSTLTPAQESAHHSGIGGSDAAAIMGLDPFRTPLDVYHSKVNPESRPDLSDNPAVQAGIRLEPVIRQWAQDEMGVKIHQSHQTIQHPDFPFLVGHIDGRIVGDRAGFEAKNRGFFRGKEYGDQGTDQVLDCEVIQCSHYMAVTGFERWKLAVLIGGQELRLFTIERDEKLIQSIIDAERHFWEEHVLKGLPPAPSTLGDIRQLYPNDDGECITLSGDSQSAINELKQIKQQVKDLRQRSEELELIVKSEAESASILTDHTGATLATWKTQTANRIDTRAMKSAHPDLCAEFTNQSTSRVLRLK